LTFEDMKVFRVGNSLAVVIPKGIVDAENIGTDFVCDIERGVSPGTYVYRFRKQK